MRDHPEIVVLFASHQGRRPLPSAVRTFARAAACALLCASCAAVPDQPQLARSVRGDTDVVENVARGVWTRDGRLVEDLRIGHADGPAEYMFGRIGAIDVDQRGRVYVYDRKFKTLRLFDHEGSFVRSMGAIGSGPGEFRDLLGLVATNAGVVGWDPSSRRMVWFASDGTPQQDRVLASASAVFTDRVMFTDSLGTLYVRTADSLSRVDADGEIRGAIAHPRTMDPPISGGFFLPSLNWTLFPDGRFASGMSDTYAITVPTAGGRWLRITRSIAPDPIPDAERKEYERVLDWLSRSRPRVVGNKAPPPVPEVRPFFERVDHDSEGRLWVLRQVGSHRVARTGSPPIPGQPRLNWVNDFEYDVFAMDGAYLGRVPLPPDVEVRVIRGDRLWAVTKDEQGLEYLVRYRLVPPMG